jgi:hypothetical protein
LNYGEKEGEMELNDREARPFKTVLREIQENSFRKYYATQQTDAALEWQSGLGIEMTSATKLCADEVTRNSIERLGSDVA